MSTSNRVRADTHVHFHACFAEGPFLDAAATALADEKLGSQTHAVLCLTESHGANWFSRLLEAEEGVAIGDSDWRISETSERNSIIASDSRGHDLVIVAGRQIVCQEGLEVLALGYRPEIDDGQEIRAVMQHVEGVGAIPVLPWGFGKWLGVRGDLVRELIEKPPCKFVLGDNGGRLAAVAEPKLFGKARDSHVAILPGTDPFPFRWDGRRVGSYGMEWVGPFDLRTPFASLKALILDESAPGQRFGRLESVPSFVRNQIAIQLRRLTNR